MDYFRSYSSFRQYRPTRSRWRSFFGIFKKRKTVPVMPSKYVIGRSKFQSREHKPRVLQSDYTRRNIIAFIALIFVLTTWFGVVLYLPYFRVNKVTYLGLNLIKRDDINNFIVGDLLKSRWSIPYNNYFLISADKIQDELMNKYSLNSVEVRKVFPGEIWIDLEEKISTIIYDNGKNFYLLDTEGNVLKYLLPVENPETNITTDTLEYYETPVQNATTTSETSTPIFGGKKTHTPEYRKLRKDVGPFPVLYDMRNMSLQEGDENILAKNFIASLIRWSEELDKQGIGTVRYMTTEHPLSGVAIYTTEPWIAYVQPQDNFDMQMANLKAILRDNLPNEYIDLRYGNRIYWK